MDGKSVQQVVAGGQPSLWDFLSQLPATIEAQQLYGLIISGLLGISANWVVKWARNEIEGNLFDYLLRDHPRNTVLSLASYVGFALATITAGALNGSGWFTVLWLGVTTGFSVDAISNKGKRSEWSEEQRQAKTAADDAIEAVNKKAARDISDAQSSSKGTP